MAEPLVGLKIQARITTGTSSTPPVVPSLRNLLPLSGMEGSSLMEVFLRLLLTDSTQSASEIKLTKVTQVALFTVLGANFLQLLVERFAITQVIPSLLLAQSSIPELEKQEKSYIL